MSFTGRIFKIAYAATTLVTRRSIIDKRGPVIGRFMRAMAEAAKIMHTDKEFTYKVLEKYLRIEQKATFGSKLQRRNQSSGAATIDQARRLSVHPGRIAPAEPRAKTSNRRKCWTLVLDEMEKSGFFDQLWGGKK